MIDNQGSLKHDSCRNIERSKANSVFIFNTVYISISKYSIKLGTCLSKCKTSNTYQTIEIRNFFNDLVSETT